MPSQLLEVFASRKVLDPAGTSNICNGATANKFKVDLSPCLKAISSLVVRELTPPLIKVLIHKVEDEALEFFRNFPSIHTIDNRFVEAVLDNLALLLLDVVKETLIPPRGPVAKVVLNALSPELVVHHLAIECEQP